MILLSVTGPQRRRFTSKPWKISFFSRFSLLWRRRIWQRRSPSRKNSWGLRSRRTWWQFSAHTGEREVLEFLSFAQRPLLEWVLSLKQPKGKIDLPRDTIDLVTCAACSLAMNNLVQVLFSHMFNSVILICYFFFANCLGLQGRRVHHCWDGGRLEGHLHWAGDPDQGGLRRDNQ